MSGPTEYHDRLGLNESPLDVVLRGCPFPATQREATVLASVVSWLGTNCGREMLRAAKDSESARLWRAHETYLAVWALENVRSNGIRGGCGGLRTIEHILGEAIETSRGRTVVRPTLSVNDFEAVDHLMLWLGQHDGQGFLLAAHEELNRRQGTEHAADEQALVNR